MLPSLASPSLLPEEVKRRGVGHTDRRVDRARADSAQHSALPPKFQDRIPPSSGTQNRASALRAAQRGVRSPTPGAQGREEEWRGSGVDRKSENMVLFSACCRRGGRPASRGRPDWGLVNHHLPKQAGGAGREAQNSTSRLLLAEHTPQLPLWVPPAQARAGWGTRSQRGLAG